MDRQTDRHNERTIDRSIDIDIGLMDGWMDGWMIERDRDVIWKVFIHYDCIFCKTFNLC